MHYLLQTTLNTELLISYQVFLLCFAIESSFFTKSNDYIFTIQLRDESILMPSYYQGGSDAHVSMKVKIIQSFKYFFSFHLNYLTWLPFSTWIFLVICVFYADVSCSCVVTSFALAEVPICMGLILLAVGAL